MPRSTSNAGDVVGGSSAPSVTTRCPPTGSAGATTSGSAARLAAGSSPSTLGGALSKRTGVTTVAAAG